jgi:hypothetical protein
MEGISTKNGEIQTHKCVCKTPKQSAIYKADLTLANLRIAPFNCNIEAYMSFFF